MIKFLKFKVGLNPLGWIRDTILMRRLISCYEGSIYAGAKSCKFAVVVAPWMGTWVPWFSVVYGLFLASRGNEVIFIISDINTEKNLFRFRYVLLCIRYGMRALHGHKILILSKYKSLISLTPSEESLIDRLSDLNATWELRGEMKFETRESLVSSLKRQLALNYQAISRVLGDAHYDVVLTPGGVWGPSGVWAYCALESGSRLASFDSGGYGTLMLSVDGIAAKLQDIPYAFRLLKARSKSVEEEVFIRKSALKEIELRRGGADGFASQIKSTEKVSSTYRNGVLLALNSSWDSAALGVHAVFDNSVEWIIETVKFLLENTTAQIIVRQHPAERLEIARTSDNYRSLLGENFGACQRLHFIAADDPINSYELLEQIDLVLVYTSTIGIEAAHMGKVVITPSNSYYSELGFVIKAKTLDQYFQSIMSGLSGKYFISEEMKKDSMYCFYLTQCCNWIYSPFNPEGFTDWSRYSLNELEGQKSVEIILEAVENNIPASFLQHIHRIRNLNIEVDI